MCAALTAVVASTAPPVHILLLRPCSGLSLWPLTPLTPLTLDLVSQRRPADTLATIRLKEVCPAGLAPRVCCADSTRQRLPPRVHCPDCAWRRLAWFLPRHCHSGSAWLQSLCVQHLPKRSGPHDVAQVELDPFLQAPHPWAETGQAAPSEEKQAAGLTACECHSEPQWIRMAVFALSVKN